MSTIRYSDGTQWLTRRTAQVSSGIWNAKQAYASVNIVGSNAISSYSAGSSGYSVASVAGVAIGDIAIVIASNRFNNSFTAPSGWTTINTQVYNNSVLAQTFYHVLNGTETWPYIFTCSLPSGYGVNIHQIILRNAVQQAPTLMRAVGGFVTKGITTGIINPAYAGSYGLFMVATNNIRTIDAPDMQVLQNTNINSSQLITAVRRLPTLQPFGSEVRFNNGLIDTFASLTYTVNPKI